MPDPTWFTEAALLSVAVTALLLALTLTAEHGPAWLLLAAVAVPLLGGWRRLPVSRPVRQLLRTPGVGAPHLALAGAATAIGVVFFIAPFFLQRALGESAATAGVILLAFPAGMALAGPIGGFLGDKWGWRRTALLGAALFTIGLLLLAPMDDSWNIADVAWRLLLAGCGNGLFNAPNMAIAMSQAPPRLLATTGATTSLARQVGFAFGPALAIVAWGLSSYRPESMTAPLLLATACSGVSVAALARLGSAREPGPHVSPRNPPKEGQHV
jgi:MFS family permease